MHKLFTTINYYEKVSIRVKTTTIYEMHTYFVQFDDIDGNKYLHMVAVQ